uniref:RNA polymerase, sigma 28 subunit, FliA/WhiG subfamily n=1 Tax=Cyanothece sp. (strain PCC 7425 / ATCC 29141) TaxID=395961 RepID=B8HUR3_CYAP4
MPTAMPTKVMEDVKNTTLQLLQAYQKNPAPSLRNRLVQMNLGLVRKEAHRWLSYSTETYEDLVQVGSLGLIRAIERFDITKGHAFSSFAMPYIRGEIQHYLRDKSPQVRIPRRWQVLQKQASLVAQELREQLHRVPTDDEMALALGIGLQEWQQVKLSSYNRSPLSLDAPVGEDDFGSTCLGEMVPDQRYRSFQLAQEDRLRLQQALQTLESRTCEILEFVFLHDLTQKETAELLGISAVTVSRQVKKGLIALRKLMSNPED